MATGELYVKDARVWVPHPDKVWEGAVLLEDYKVNRPTLKVRTEDDNQWKHHEIKNDTDLPPLRNPEILMGVNNLTSLSFLHEAAVLYNLQIRFHRRYIYTYCGIVLVACNPYDELPIYGNDTIWTYRGQAMGDLEPHIFAVAEEAYTKLEREGHDQSIIVSGESGAGKTVSAKYTMRYFAIVGGSSTETQVERKVLASSPIMEAIGNAKTTRNDNSSRFGKFIEIYFDKNHHITGAGMRIYLLEKSRVVFQANEERNYHIFYQMCAAAGRLPQLHLSHPNNFHYLNQGRNPSIEGVDDLAHFDKTVTSLTMLGFTSRQQNDLFRILAAILHLGNITIIGKEGEGVDGEASFISPNDKHLLTISELLGTNVNAMQKWLCHRKFVSMREVFLKPMNVNEATRARDALAKHIYAELFNRIVAGINTSLRSPNKIQCFIGVLDIYGFETFEMNSFEQFCINYANEKLQQQFNQHVFKLQQDEYLREEIEWTLIEFYDNQPCIDLIEAKLGILDLLDEECRMPKGSDSSWAEKLYSNCKNLKHFEKPRFGTSAFLIRHFADLVEYETFGFLEKNRDTVIGEQIDVLRGGKNKLLKKLFADENPKLDVPNVKTKMSAQKPFPSNSKQKKKTVGSLFRVSLNMLMSTLNATKPHYVRCIKPNDTKESFGYNPTRAVQQLRACGVLETVRISAAGFPSHKTYAEFFQRYRNLCKFKNIRRDDLKETCRRILVTYIDNEDKFKIGKTKVLLRAGQLAYLEKLRAEKQRDASTMIQKIVRGWICRNRYRKIHSTILGLQRHGRGYMGRQRAQAIKYERAAIKIQARVKGCLQRRWYLQVKRTVLGIQTYGRGFMARQQYKLMKENAAAMVIQKFVRGYLARLACEKKLRDIVRVQCCVRKYFARKAFKKLKAEARSVEHVKSLNKGLEKKIIMLQQRINELTKENHHLKNVQTEVVDLKSKLSGLKSVDAENKKLNGILIDKEKELKRMQVVLVQERDEKMDLLQDKEKAVRQQEQENKLLNEENEKLRKELGVANDKLKNNLRGAEENFKHRLEQEKDLLLLDQDQDREAYQRLLKQYYELEQHVEILEQKLALDIPGDLRSLSNVSTCSGQIISTALPQDDQNIEYGYGSVRSTASSPTPYSRMETIDQQSSDTSPNGEVQSSKSQFELNRPAQAHVDIGLVLKLQQKLKDVQKEKSRLIRTVEDLERESPDEASTTQDTFRLQELEMENVQLRKDLGCLRETVCEADSTTAHQNLIGQFDALQKEVERRREECIQLHTVLADRTEIMKSFGSNYSGNADIINEDGELVLAFESQKKINRQLEDELQSKEEGWRAQRDGWRAEFDRLQEEIEKHQKLISVNVGKSPQTQIEAYMQHEITRLTRENLDLQEKYDKAAEENRRIRRQFKILANRLRGAGLPDSTALDNNSNVVPSSSHSSSESGNNLPVVRKKERDYEGMFECRSENITTIIRYLVVELKPKVAVTLLTGLPAYILFMCIRHADYINDDDTVRSLLNGYLNAVKRVVKKRESFDSTVLWLSNTLRLMHIVKQYSGDKPFQCANTPRQNEQCLRNFDLSEYRRVFSDVALWIFNNLVTNLKYRLQPLIIPALLEHEEITGLDSNKPRSARSHSIGKKPDSTQQKLDELLDELTAVHKTLIYYGIDPDVVVQIFKQLFYFMCAIAVNNLLLRHELCQWTKGMQIIYNISYLEQWSRDKKVTSAIEALQPIIQAARLLQARKSDGDVDAVCEMSQALKVTQIIKILNLYTPADDYETRVPDSFIREVQEKLNERGETNEQLLMDLKFTYPVRFAFNPSNVRLEEIEVPEVLCLPMLKKV